MANPLLGYWYKLYMNPTAAEQALEPALASLGVPYRIQVPAFPFILDFTLPSLRVNIEVDGDSHLEPAQKKKDKARDAKLRSKGWTIVRVRNETVLADPYGAVDAMMAKLKLPYRTRRV